MQEFQYMQDVLKTHFAPAIKNLLNTKAILWAQIKKHTEGVYGKRFAIPVTLGFPESVGARYPNLYALPEAARSSYDQAYIYQKRNYGRITIDGLSIESAKGKGGWLDAVTLETKNSALAFAIDMDRQTFLNGQGVLALCNGVTPITNHVVTVDTPGGVVDTNDLTRWFRKGMVIDIITPGTGVKTQDSITVTAVGTTTITVSGDVAGSADNNLIVREDSCNLGGAAGSKYGEMMGVNGIVSDTNYPEDTDFEGIDRAANPEFCADVTALGGVLTELAIQNELDKIAQRTDADAPDMMLTTYAIRNKFISLVNADRMISGTDLKGGWTAIKYLGGSVSLPILVHRGVPTGYIYFLNTKALRLYTLKDLVWDDKGGVLKNVAGFDSFESWYKLYAQLGSDMPNSMGVLTGVTV